MNRLWTLMNADYFNREPHKTCENYSLSASTGERVRVRCRIHFNHGWTRIFNREPCEPLERWVSSRLPVRLAPSRPLPAAREALTLHHHRHPVVNAPHGFIRGRRQDDTAKFLRLQIRLPFRFRLPQTRNYFRGSGRQSAHYSGEGEV